MSNTAVTDSPQREPSKSAHGTLRVCYFGTYRAEYSRNRIMIEGLRRNNVQVIECQEPLWHSIEDRVDTVAGGWKRPAFWGRVAHAYLRLLRRFWDLRHQFDVLVVGYPGQFDVYLARLLSWWTRKPLAWDIFMSIYLIAQERGLEKRHRGILTLIRVAERAACHLPDLLIIDTDEYVRWFGRTHGVSAVRFRLVPTGADSDRFRPLPLHNRSDGIFRVVYYGTFIPNHGVATIIEAARLLAEDRSIRIELIGDGPDRAAAMQLANGYGLTNVQFADWLNQAALIQRVAEADLCLGAFGDTPQSVMTVQNKIYEGLAMQRPVLTGDSPAVRQKMHAGKEIYVCARSNPAALAAAIRTLSGDPGLCQQLATQGRQAFAADYTIERLGALYRSHIEALLTQPAASRTGPYQPVVTNRPARLCEDSSRAEIRQCPMVSVIIPNLNSPLIANTLRAIRAQTFIPSACEVLVVGLDEPGLVQCDDMVQLISSKGPAIPAADRNLGIAKSRGEILCFTDADCVPDPDWLAQILSWFQDERIDVVGGGVKYR